MRARDPLPVPVLALAAVAALASATLTACVGDDDASPDGGALVLEVQPGSPADTAGIRPGDVVVRLGEDDVSEVGDLLGALLASTPGDRVEVTVLRDGRERTVEVELGRTEAG